MTVSPTSLTTKTVETLANEHPMAAFGLRVVNEKTYPVLCLKCRRRLPEGLLFRCHGCSEARFQSVEEMKVFYEEIRSWIEHLWSLGFDDDAGSFYDMIWLLPEHDHRNLIPSFFSVGSKEARLAWQAGR